MSLQVVPSSHNATRERRDKDGPYHRPRLRAADSDATERTVSRLRSAHRRKSRRGRRGRTPAWRVVATVPWRRVVSTALNDPRSYGRPGPSGQILQRGRGLRNDRRMIAQHRAGDTGPQLDRGCSCSPDVTTSCSCLFRASGGPSRALPRALSAAPGAADSGEACRASVDGRLLHAAARSGLLAIVTAHWAP